MDKKGIFCLEGHWNDDLKSKSTILPILDLLNKQEKVQYIYNQCATKDEFEFFIKKWKLKKYQAKYPILYLAFHGEKELIHFGFKKSYKLNELAVILENSCKGSVIFFASCLTMGTRKNIINNFILKTQTLAVLGYKVEVDWMKATAFELLVLASLMGDKFDTQGINKMKSTIMTEYGKLHKEVDFDMFINEYLHFPRKRKKVIAG